jgi:phosphopantothenoylcysteine decarboxylase
MRKPLLLAPAMNTHMWAHPLTARQILEVKLIGYRVIAPIAKRLACGDVGVCDKAKS